MIDLRELLYIGATVTCHRDMPQLTRKQNIYVPASMLYLADGVPARVVENSYAICDQRNPGEGNRVKIQAIGHGDKWIVSLSSIATINGRKFSLERARIDIRKAFFSDTAKKRWGSHAED